MRVAVLTTDNREHWKTYDALAPSFGTAPVALLQGFTSMSDLEVHVISCTQRPMTSPERLAGNIWFHSLHVPKIGWLRTSYQGCIRAVRRKLREIRPHLVHGQGTERDCAISAVFSGFPAVVTIHGNMSQLAKAFGGRIGSYQWFAARLEDFTLPRADGVLCNSTYTRSLVQERAARTWLVPNPIRLPFFETPLPNQNGRGKPILISIGVISERKRQLDSLEMAERLRRSGHDLKVVFVGAADPHDKYAAAFLKRIKATQKLARQRHVDSVTELVQLIDNSAALIHIPSEEAFGLAVAEALARNRKLFATDVGGIPEIASGVQGPELFPLHEEQQLENAITRWLETGTPNCEGAQAVMKRRYHPAVVARQHLAIYEEVLSTRS